MAWILGPTAAASCVAALPVVGLPYTVRKWARRSEDHGGKETEYGVGRKEACPISNVQGRAGPHAWWRRPATARWSASPRRHAHGPRRSSKAWTAPSTAKGHGGPTVRSRAQRRGRAARRQAVVVGSRPAVAHVGKDRGRPLAEVGVQMGIDRLDDALEGGVGGYITW